MALLRRPGSFEGLVRIEVLANSNHLAVLEIRQPHDRRLGLNAALLALSMQVADREDPLAKVPELRGLGPELNESLLQLSDPLAGALVTPVETTASPPSSTGSKGRHSTLGWSSSSSASTSRRL